MHTVVLLFLPSLFIVMKVINALELLTPAQGTYLLNGYSIVNVVRGISESGLKIGR